MLASRSCPCWPGFRVLHRGSGVRRGRDGAVMEDDLWQNPETQGRRVPVFSEDSTTR